MIYDWTIPGPWHSSPTQILQLQLLPSQSPPPPSLNHRYPRKRMKTTNQVWEQPITHAHVRLHTYTITHADLLSIMDASMVARGPFFSVKMVPGNFWWSGIALLSDFLTLYFFTFNWAIVCCFSSLSLNWPHICNDRRIVLLSFEHKHVKVASQSWYFVPVYNRLW